MNEFINLLIQKLDGKISDEALKIVHTQVSILCTDYDISRKETLPAVLFDDVEEVKMYLVSRKIEGLSQSTLSAYKYELQRFFQTVQKRTKDITANDIRLYLYNAKEAQNLSNRTLNNMRSYIKAFFVWCVDNEYITKNPCAIISHIKSEDIERYPISPLDLERLRRACKDERDRAIIETLYSTGCRVSELVNIKLTDINTDEKSISIMGKGKKHRTVYINAKAEIAINEYLATRPQQSDYLFCSVRKSSNPLSTRWIEKLLLALGERAGISDVHPHKFRRTMATDALEHGMSLEEVQALLGHEDINTTLIYAKVKSREIQSSHRKYVV